MKKRFLAISLILLLSAIAITGCREINRLKKVVVYDKTIDMSGTGRYAENKLVLFIVEENGKSVYFKGYNLETWLSFILYRERIEGTPNYEYGYGESFFGIEGWDENDGLYVFGMLFAGSITGKEFKDKAKSLIEFILENPMGVMETMREAAKDLGLIEKPDPLQTI